MRRLAVAACLALAASPLQAKSFIDLNDLARANGAQDLFNDLSGDLGAGLGYQALMPAGARKTLAAPIAFEAGAALQVAPLTSAGDVNDAVDDLSDVQMGDLPETLYLPSLRANASFPYNLSAGAAYARIPGTSVNYMGGELRWSGLDWTGPGVAAARLTGSRLTGIEDFSLTTYGAEAVVSANLALAEPYAHAGLKRVAARAGVDALDDYATTQSKIGAGLRFTIFPFATATVEANRIAGNTVYGVRLGVGS